MRESRKPSHRKRDRAEEILDYWYDDRNRQLRAACRKIIRGSSHGLAIYDELNKIDAAARKKATKVLPHPAFLNLQGLLWLFQFELACLLEDYIRSQNERRWLYARLLLLSLYESTRTLARIFSKGYQSDLEAKLGPEYKDQVRELHAYIHWASKDLEADYASIRNHLVGHRDADASLRRKALSSLDGLEIKDFAWEVLEWCAAVSQIDQLYLAAIDRLNGMGS